MKKRYYIAFAILTLLFAACSNEDAIENGGNTGKTEMKVSFKGINTVATRADAPLQTTQEATVEFIDLFLFRQDDGTLALKSKISGEDLEKGTELGTYTATFYLDIEGGTDTYYYAAVANHSITVTESFDYDELKKEATNKTFTATDYFVMLDKDAGEGEVTVTENMVNTLSIELKRLAARIDFENNVYKENSETETFILKKARLVNPVSSSFIVPGGTPAKTGSGNGTWIDLKNASAAAGVANGEKAYSQMYTYENTQAGNVAGGTNVEIYGTYRGKDYQTIVSFGDKAITRNNRYVIKVTHITESGITAEVFVSDWTEGTEVPFDPEDGKQLKVEVELEDGEIDLADDSKNPATEEDEEVFMTIPADADVLTFNVKSSNLESVAEITEITGTWLKVKALPETKTEPEYLMENTFMFEAEKNEVTEDRTATLVVRNKLNAHKDVKITYVITQKAASLVDEDRVGETFLDQFAEYDLSTTYTANGSSIAAQQVIAGASHVYQWSRNNGFPTNVADVRNETRPGSSTKFGLNTGSTDYYSSTNSGSYGSSWNSNPCTLAGSNYRMPTSSELSKLIPSTAGVFVELRDGGTAGALAMKWVFNSNEENLKLEIIAVPVISTTVLTDLTDTFFSEQITAENATVLTLIPGWRGKNGWLGGADDLAEYNSQKYNFDRTGKYYSSTYSSSKVSTLEFKLYNSTMSMDTNNPWNSGRIRCIKNTSN